MKQVIRRILIILFSTTLVISLTIMIYQIVSYKQAADNYKNLCKTVVQPVANLEPPLPQQNTAAKQEPEIIKETAPIQVDFSLLQAENPDIIGWVYCPGLGVDYPILKGDNNEQYLRHLWNGEYRISGSIFMDYRNTADFSDRNTVIYGHNMKDGSMFACLSKYQEQAVYEENPVWYILTPEQDYKVVLFAGYITKAGSSIYDKTISDENWDFYLRETMNQSMFQLNEAPESNNKIVTFSTCAYVYQNARFVLQGFLIELDKL